MIYTERKIDLEFAYRLFDLALSLRGAKIAFWPYPPPLTRSYLNDFREKLIHFLNPRSNKLGIFWKELTPFLIDREELEVVTFYDNDTRPTKIANSYYFNENIIKMIGSNFVLILEKMDSISIYKEGEIDWFLCMIFHEKMSLLKIPEDELKYLETAKIPYSLEPPAWW